MEPIAEEFATKVEEALAKMIQEQTAAIVQEMGPQAAAFLGEMRSLPRKTARQIKKQLSDEVMQGQLQDLFPVYSAEPVKTGESWTNASTTPSPFPMMVTTTYTVTARSGGVTNVDFDSKVTASPGATMDLGMATAKVDATGQEKGSYQIDDATGWVTAGNKSVNHSIGMDMGEVSIPIRVDGSIHLKGFEGQ